MNFALPSRKAHGIYAWVAGQTLGSEETDIIRNDQCAEPDDKPQDPRVPGEAVAFEQMLWGDGLRCRQQTR